jgi:hypothetical protein
MDGLLDILFALRDLFTSEGILNTRTSSCSTQVADWSDLGTVSDSLSVDSSMLLHLGTGRRPGEGLELGDVSC